MNLILPPSAMIVTPPDDMWDPNTWDLSEPERRIYGDDKASIWAIVDEIDYEWAQRYRWCPNVKKSRGDPTKTKTYLRRAVGENHQGIRLRTYTLYLHTEILKRAEPNPPSKRHVIADHRDGVEMNCRRSNLRWATHSMNSFNRFGSMPHDLVEG